MKSRLPERFSFAVAWLTLIHSTAQSAETYVAFEGEKSAWHDGFDRYDFVMDESTLAIKSFKAPSGEKFGITDPPKGQRRCVVIVPRKAAPDNPWSWQACYWNHEPQTEVELLRRGFHIAYTSANATLRPGKEWDAWYAFLTQRHGLSAKPAFIGMSRGGQYAYTWATANPDKVSCIYADNPVAHHELMMKLNGLVTNDVPLLHVCGSIDPLSGKVSMPIERIYQELGGRISVMIKDGIGHHPHSLRDPKPIADFIEQSVQPINKVAPDYLRGRITKSSFYSIENSFREFPKEGTFVTSRGAWFAECYDRYTFELVGVDGPIMVTVPNTAARGKPWVFRADFVGRDSTVDLALLAKGFHIVTGPVFHNADGPSLAHWNTVYKHLTAHGFSSKPVMAGAGRAAGEVYAWATENPEKVSCIYGENPVLRSTMLPKTTPLDSLPRLAKAGVPLLHVCGSLDPALETNTRLIEKRYEELGGSITVILKEGEAHYPLPPKDPTHVVDFITSKAH
jgi:pimeloyl-ACP methyl ester carboxylesterase